jgi:subtilisin family serine protease
VGRWGIVLAVLLAVCSPAASAGAQASAQQRVEMIVGFAPHASAASVSAALADAGARTLRSFAPIHARLVSVPASSHAAAARAFAGVAGVRYAEPNGILTATDVVPNDPGFGQQWGLRNTGQTINFSAGTPGADIHATQAWGVTTGSAPVTVGVIDTGVDMSHPDLSRNVWANPGESCAGCATDGADNDGNGYVDDVHGWNFVSGTPNPADDNGHGTHVAGIIAAAGNNGTGIAGVDWNARIMPLKFLDASGQGTTADAITALLYATANGARVTNNSYGGDSYSQAMADAIAYAGAHGVLFVTAAGNSGADLDASPSYPASYQLPNVITVAATDNTDSLAYFSDVGAASVDLGAPGVDVYSTWPGGGYRMESGTSMAAPAVAGAAALVESADPSATPAGVRALLDGTAHAVPDLAGVTRSGGRLDVNAALRCANTPEVLAESPGQGFTTTVGTPVPVTVIATNCADPGGVSVTGSDGAGAIALSPAGGGVYNGSYTPSHEGPVTLTFSATVGAATATATVSGSVPQTIQAGGPAVTVTTATAGQNASLAFTGSAGERVSLTITNVTMGTSTCCAALVSVSAPDGSAVGSPAFVGTGGGFLDTRTLPAAGVYTITVDPQGTATGSMTLQLADVPPDVTAPIVAGGSPVTLTMTAAGQNASATFSAAAGARVSLKVSGSTIGTSTCCGARITILAPNGTAAAPTTFVGTSGTYVDAVTLASAGAYSIAVDPQGAATGSLTLTLYAVPPDATASTTPGATGAAVQNTVPGQNMRVTFPGTAGERIVLRVSASSLSTARLTLQGPTGATVGNLMVFGVAGLFVDTQTLPSTGTYTLLVDPQGAITGGATLAVADVPPDAAAAITPGGATVSLSMPAAGQNGSATFTGAAGERVSLRITSTISFALVTIQKPGGGALTTQAAVGTAGGFVDTVTLPAAGIYAIAVDPQQANTGTVGLTLYDVPADATAAATVGGAAVTIAMPVPGQNGAVTFSGTAGQTVTIKLGSAALSQSKVTVLRPDGTALVAAQYIFSTGKTFQATLDASGTYTIAVDPQQAVTGSMTVTLT